MPLPKKDEITHVLKELERKDPTLVIDFKTASKSDILKYRLCQEFIKILKDEQLTQVQLAEKLGVNKSIVNKIVHHKIETFTVDRLMDLLSIVRSIEIFLTAS